MPRKPTGKPNGRPKGARNKSKAARPRAAEAPVKDLPAPAPVSPSAGLPDGTSSLLAYHHARLSAIGQDLAKARADKASLTKDIAPLIAAESTCLKAIAELTGATRLTEQKVFASDVWKAIKTRLQNALAPFPEAVAALMVAANEAGESTTEDPT